MAEWKPLQVFYIDKLGHRSIFGHESQMLAKKSSELLFGRLEHYNYNYVLGCFWQMFIHREVAEYSNAGVPIVRYHPMRELRYREPAHKNGSKIVLSELSVYVFTKISHFCHLFNVKT